MLLNHPTQMPALRDAVRPTMVDRDDLATICLPQQRATTGFYDRRFAVAPLNRPRGLNPLG